MLITSLQNPRVKNVVKLRQRRQRDAQQLTVVEGTREVLRALQQGIVPQEAFICPELIADEEAETAVTRLHQLPQTLLNEVTPEVFAKMAYREDSGGLLLVIPYWERTLDALLHSGQPAFLTIIEGVEKPGNLGAILRTADAAGVEGVILAHGAVDSTDLYNPNVVRASLGTIFSVPVASGSNASVIHWLRQRGIKIIATTPASATRYTAVNLTAPVAIVMGSEAHGLSNEWINAADEQVIIPMHGIADSLNLSVATALLLYEVVRQRQQP
ncbi:MAG: RNA methyltransferase [Ardenticatenaceae bacterium]|nr:RNA methyltransferase [Ardenticatenaceae bacterium]MCB9443117.1 RNA methyltransferase [Ardenticatenaceae bacterium]